MADFKHIKRFVTGAAAEKVAALRTQNKLLERQNSLLLEQITLLTKVSEESKRTRDVAENIRGVVMAPIRHEISDLMQRKQLGFLETISAIRDEKLSFARYGDGEFRLLYRLEHKLKFQRNSPELMSELKRVLTAPSNQTLLGMPQVFLGLHWSIVFAETWHFVGPLVATQKRFGNSHVTRPIFFEHHGQGAVDAWRSVWQGREAVVVTGQGSRFGLVPALFDNLSSVTEIFSTPTDAFIDLDRLVREIEETGRNLVLLSLGPAATIAADMLAARGIQALDIGHLSASYENVVSGGLLPEHLPPVRNRELA